MKKWKMSGRLPYLIAPVLILLLWITKREQTVPSVLLLQAVLLAFGAAASLWDLREKRIPNRLILYMLGAGVLIVVPQLFFQTEQALALLASGLIGALLGGILFLTVYMVSRKGLGGGDVKLMAVSGLYLGAGSVLPAMLYGSVLAAVTAGVLIALKKIGRKDAIPLVPFLYAGMLITVFIQGGVII